ncbi:MAG TPA: GNAT family N-acetyltransferase [Candidatus Binatia bacterium]|nr:GNAT family N-acetyltransferase [Candidatus Binatia bacterium]
MSEALVLRPVTASDARVLGPICYEAFRAIAERHGFPPDLPSPEFATGLIEFLVARDGIHGVAAELGGRLVGSNFVDERSTIAGIGPITVDPGVQDRSVGRRLMDAVLARVAERGSPGVRLVQAAYHNRSLSLYTKLGFDPVEPLSTLQGQPIGAAIPGHDVRAGRPADLDACDALCRRVHGHDRHGEVRDALAAGQVSVVEHDGRLTGYTTGVAFFGHTVGETNEDVKALVGAATAFAGPGFLLPTRNSTLLRWCLERGLRIVQPMTLMARGLYNEPRGAFLPSIMY